MMGGVTLSVLCPSLCIYSLKTKIRVCLCLCSIKTMSIKFMEVLILAQTKKSAVSQW